MKDKDFQPMEKLLKMKLHETIFKDLFYDCEAGERTITLYLYHCAACGEPSHVEI